METSLLNLDKIEEVIPEFEMYLNGKGLKYFRERKKTKDFLKVYLFEYEAIDSLDGEMLEKLVNELWVFSDCVDKEFLLTELLSSGIKNIKKGFKILLDEESPLPQRFNWIKENIKIIDERAITELLSYYREHKYPILSDFVLKGLVYLEVKEDEIPSTTEIKGEEYELYCQLMHDILHEINSKYPQVKTLQDLQFLLFFIANEKDGQPLNSNVNTLQNKSSNNSTSSDSNDFSDTLDTEKIIENIMHLGAELGFEVDKNVYISGNYKIAAIWKSKIANLVITYAFSVLNEDVNIKRAAEEISEVTRIDPSIQKVFVVCRTREYEILKERLQELNISRNLISHFKINDLKKALSYLENLKGILDELGLLKFDA